MTGPVPTGEATRFPAGVPFIDEARLRALVPMTSAVVCVEAALSEGRRPAWPRPARRS